MTWSRIGFAPALCLSTIGLFAPRGAEAFLLADEYDASPEEGGGGGRYFSGSPADGAGCEVCHEGGDPDRLTVIGLPEGGRYVGGAQYAVDIALPDAAFASLALEIATEDGASLGDLALEPNPQEEERCPNNGVLASHLKNSGNRRVVVVDACGAQRVRVRWVPPAGAEEPAWFSALAVEGDGSASPDGDRIYASLVRLTPDGVIDPTASTVGCQLDRRRPPQGPPWALVVLGWLLAITAYRRRAGRSTAARRSYRRLDCSQ